MSRFGHRPLAALAFLALGAQQVSAQPSFKVSKPEISFAQGLMEALEPPEGTRGREGGAGQSDSEATAHRILVTALSVEELLSFYQGRLSDRGWAPGASQVEPELAFQVLRLADKEGAQFLGLLVVAVTDAEHDIKIVSMQAFPVSAP